MIVISMLLVVVGFLTLMMGVLNVGVGDLEPLSFVYISIGACVLAGLFLIIGVVRGRPSRKPAMASGAEGQVASWSGASSWHRGEAAEAERAPESAPQPEEPPAADEDADAAGVQVVTAPEDAPMEAEQSPDVASGRAPAEEQVTPHEDDVVVVPKRSAADRPGEPGEDGAQPPAAAKKTAVKSAKKAAKRTAKKAAKKTTREGAKKASGKPAKRTSTTRTEAAGSSGQGVEARLAGIAGVGPAKRNALLDHFGGPGALASATPDRLAEVDGISETLARRIYDALRD